MTLRKGMGSWWRDACIYRFKGVPLKTKCQRVISHVFSTVLNGSINWNLDCGNGAFSSLLGNQEHAFDISTKKIA